MGNLCRLFRNRRSEPITIPHTPSRLELLPYEIRAIIFSFLGYGWMEVRTGFDPGDAYTPPLRFAHQRLDSDVGLKTLARVVELEYDLRYSYPLLEHTSVRVPEVDYIASPPAIAPLDVFIAYPVTDELIRLPGRYYEPAIMAVNRSLTTDAMHFLFRDNVALFQQPLMGKPNPPW